jgi:hypothetical protein
MNEYELFFGADGRRFERERGLADDNLASRETRLAASPLWLTGGGVDSRGGVRWEPGAGPHPAASRRDDARLWRLVREALFRSGFGSIDVSVADGLVTLEGSVADIPTRVMAEECCLTLPEIRDVRNRLRVEPALAREVGG